MAIGLGDDRRRAQRCPPCVGVVAEVQPRQGHQFVVGAAGQGAADVVQVVERNLIPAARTAAGQGTAEAKFQIGVAIIPHADQSPSGPAGIGAARNAATGNARLVGQDGQGFDAPGRAQPFGSVAHAEDVAEHRARFLGLRFDFLRDVGHERDDALVPESRKNVYQVGGVGCEALVGQMVWCNLAPRDAGKCFVGQQSFEFFEQDGLSDSTYGTLEKSGFPREVVDAFIAGQNAMREQFDNKVRSVAGNQHDAMLDWADSNLTENQIAAYNNAYNSGDPDAAMMAAEYIFNRYKSENNKGVKVYQGETSGLGGVQPYGSMKEAAIDMGRPEYKDQNSSFHKQVQRRLQVSKFPNLQG